MLPIDVVAVEDHRSTWKKRQRDLFDCRAVCICDHRRAADRIGVEFAAEAGVNVVRLLRTCQCRREQDRKNCYDFHSSSFALMIDLSRLLLLR